jgi:diacylglycerol kinase family enzyme
MLSAEHTVSIKSRTSMLVQVDGDVIGKTPVEIQVIPGALTVLVPDERMTKVSL